MLSVSRLIGHKEYGNTPPGGWPGRKQDPQYDMDWRRRRVAGFTPRNAPTPVPEDDDMPSADEIADALIKKLRTADMSPAPGEQGFWYLLSQTNTAVTSDLESMNLGADGEPIAKGTPRRFWLWIDRHVYQANREKLPYVIRLLEAIASKTGVDVAAIEKPPAHDAV